MIDKETIARGAAAANAAVTEEKNKVIKAAVWGAVALALPVLEAVFPQYIAIIKALRLVLPVFGMGAA